MPSLCHSFAGLFVIYLSGRSMRWCVCLHHFSLLKFLPDVTGETVPGPYLVTQACSPASGQRSGTAVNWSNLGWWVPTCVSATRKNKETGWHVETGDTLDWPGLPPTPSRTLAFTHMPPLPSPFAKWKPPCSRYWVSRRHPCQRGGLVHTNVGSTLVRTCACISSARLENQCSQCNFDRGVLRTAPKSHCGEVSWLSTQQRRIWLERRTLFFITAIVQVFSEIRSFANFSTQAIRLVWGWHFLSKSHDCHVITTPGCLACGVNVKDKVG